MPFSSPPSHADYLPWERLHCLLALGYHVLLATPEYGLKVTELADVLRTNLSPFADPYLLDLVRELLSLFPSSLSIFQQTMIKVQQLSPVVQEADALTAHISEISLQLAFLRENYDRASHLGSHLRSYVDAALHIRDFLSDLAIEWEDSSGSNNQLTQAELLIDHSFNLYRDIARAVDNLVDTMYTKAHQLADLELQKAKLQSDLNRHTYLVSRLNSLETNLKVLVAKIEAYFRFM